MKLDWFKNKETRILLSCTFLVVFGIFLALPIIGVHALKAYHLTSAQIGLLAGIWPGTVFSLTFFCGMLADRIGYLKSVRLGISIVSIAFGILALAPNVWVFAFGLFLCGFGKAFFDSSMRALFTVYIKPEDRENLFRFRYMLANTAVIVGPLIGILIYNSIGQLVFFSTTFFCILVFISSFFLTRIPQQNENANRPKSFREKFGVLKDPRLFSWIVSGTLISMAFSAFESLMPVISTVSNGQRPSFAILASLNASVVVVVQLVHLRFFKNLPAWQASLYGACLMGAGFLSLTILSQPFLVTVVGIVLLSIGEALLLPSFDIFMDRIAPREEKALYFGAGELRQIGCFLGPALGGRLLESGGISWLFFLCFLWLGLSMMALKFALRVRAQPLPFRALESS